MPTGPALRTAVISLVAIMVGTLLAAGICVFEIVRAPVDTALAWGIGLGFAISASVLMAGCRLLRLLRARRAGRAVAEPRRVVPLLGVCKKIYAPYLVLVPLTGHLPDPEDVRYAPGVVELQRFLWDPAINRLSPGDEVLLHRSGRCVVVDLLDGARLWPSGSLRTSEPNGWTLTERPSGVRSRYRELRERPAAVTRPRPPR